MTAHTLRLSRAVDTVQELTGTELLELAAAVAARQLAIHRDTLAALWLAEDELNPEHEEAIGTDVHMGVREAIVRLDGGTGDGRERINEVADLYED